MPKLIILRGNSASGKSTIAKLVRERSNRKIAIVEQDYLRRFILKEKESKGTNNIDLIYQTVTFALARDYDVILEGILYFPRYGKMLKQLLESYPEHYIFYMEVSFEETLKRHATKPVANDYGEAQLKEWYKADQRTHLTGEVTITETATVDDSVTLISKAAGL